MAIFYVLPQFCDGIWFLLLRSGLERFRVQIVRVAGLKKDRTGTSLALTDVLLRALAGQTRYPISSSNPIAKPQIPEFAIMFYLEISSYNITWFKFHRLLQDLDLIGRADLKYSPQCAISRCYSDFDQDKRV